MIRVITIAREYGSGGGAIAQMLAQKLGWKLLDRELIWDLAKRAHCKPEDVARYDEHTPSFLSQLMRAYWAGSPYSWASSPSTTILDADSLAAMTASVIQEAAELGRCVIVGRGAQCVLRDYRDAFHALIYAPTNERLKRLKDRHETTAAAEAATAQTDNVRASYVRKYYGQNWSDRNLYHLLLNSALGDSAVVATLRTASGLAGEVS
jgi:cytidylate kinase